jgi:AsmA protein
MANATLYRPNMVIDIDSSPIAPDSAIGRATRTKSTSAEAATADEAKLGTVTLVEGNIRLVDRAGAGGAGSWDTSIQDVDVTVDWRDLGASAIVTGRASYHGEATELAAWIAQPAELLRGAQSAVTLRLKAAAGSLQTNGNLFGSPQFRYTGKINASGTSLRRLAEIGDTNFPFPGPFENVDLSCDAEIVGADASLSNIHLSLDGTDFEGALALRNAMDKPILSGTLATNLFDLTPFAASLPTALQRNGQWNHKPFELKDLDLVDLDLRISAARLKLARVEMDEAALSLMTKNGRTELALAQAKAYQGSMRGRASIVANESGLDLRLTGALSRVDLGALSSDLYGRQKLSGSITATAGGESVGSNVGELMRNLRGWAQISLEQGAIPGIDLEQALRWIDKRPLAMAVDVRGRRTSFDSASLTLRIDKGVAEIENGLLNGLGAHLSFSGQAGIAERTLDIHAVAQQPLPDGTTNFEGPQFGFAILGPWDEPALVPDLGTLIRRSGVTAPLLQTKPDAAVIVESPTR